MSFSNVIKRVYMVPDILSQLQPKYGNNIGLYRDDGLAAFNKTAREIENIKKDICKVFKDNNLKVTIDANKKIIDYLDVTLELHTGVYKPYVKPNNAPMYVHSKSNHPPNVIRNIPKGINQRLSEISSSQEIFDRAKMPYQKALNDSGYSYNLHYSPPSTSVKRHRKRNITWFNPPYDISVKTNIGKKFLQLIDRCFPLNHPLRKVCNRNNLKVSYSCMPNVGSIIQGDNKKKLQECIMENENSSSKLCNCRKKDQCPLRGKCLEKNVIYQAEVKCDKQTETYVGLASTDFKARFRNHINSFNDIRKRHNTELSNFIWSLKDSNRNFSTTWKILCKAKPYNTVSKRCNLCIAEKYFIICKPSTASLNKRSELISKCRHQSKYLIGNVT